MKNVLLFLLLCLGTSAFSQHGVRIFNQTKCDFTVTIESFDYLCNAVNLETLLIPAGSTGTSVTTTPNSRWLRANAVSSPICPYAVSQVPVPPGGVHNLDLGSPCPFTCLIGLPPSSAVSAVATSCCGPFVRGVWTTNSFCGEIILSQ